jgi:glyoxylase-like metal-dependent hydrolase (beta-lactamase superfamily II)
LIPDRRSFLKAAIGGAAGLSLLRAPGVLAAERTDAPTATPLGAGLTHLSGLGGNVVVLEAPDGLLLVDSGLAERSGELLRWLGKAYGGRRVKTLINTHWHWDHTGANERLAREGARILAHENTKLWLGADIYIDWQDKRYPPRPKEAWPTETFYTSGKLTFADQEVAYGYLPRAHTDGDIYVYFPRANVLASGCVVSVGSYPILDYPTGGWIGGMVDASASLLELCNAETRIVPGVGPVQTRADLQAQHDMLSTLKDRLVGLMKKGYGIDDWVNDPPTREFDAKWGDPKQFLINTYHGLWGHVRELGGIV